MEGSVLDGYLKGSSGDKPIHACSNACVRRYCRQRKSRQCGKWFHYRVSTRTQVKQVNMSQKGPSRGILSYHIPMGVAWLHSHVQWILPLSTSPQDVSRCEQKQSASSEAPCHQHCPSPKLHSTLIVQGRDDAFEHILPKHSAHAGAALLVTAGSRGCFTCKQQGRGGIHVHIYIYKPATSSPP